MKVDLKFEPARKGTRVRKEQIEAFLRLPGIASCNAIMGDDTEFDHVTERDMNRAAVERWMITISVEQHDVPRVAHECAQRNVGRVRLHGASWRNPFQVGRRSDGQIKPSQAGASRALPAAS